MLGWLTADGGAVLLVLPGIVVGRGLCMVDVNVNFFSELFHQTSNSGG